MTKSGIQFLAKFVSEKHKVNQREAVKFVRAFFDVLNEGLQEQKLVRVRGLGTFKVIDVKDRESVDVNTGERIVIEGRSKISFVPDNMMKELVNKPFSQFETVVLNDGVDFQDVETSISENPNEDVFENDVDSSIEVSDMEDNQVSESTMDRDEIDQIIDKSDEPLSVMEEESEVMKDNVSNDISETNEAVEQINHEVAALSQPITSEIQETTLESDNEQPSNSGNISIVESKDKESTVSDNNQMDLVPESHDDIGYSFWNWFWNIAAALVIAVLSFVAGIHYERENKTKQLAEVVASQNQTEKPINSHKDTATQYKEGVQSVDSHNNAEDNKDNSQQTVTTPDNQKQDERLNKHEESLQNEITENKKSQITAEEQNSLRIARQIVSTGAYNIIGTETTVKVKKGQTLKSISRVYLGDGMDCYVIVHNGFSNVTEGQTLKIPKLQLKKFKKRK